MGRPRLINPLSRRPEYYVWQDMKARCHRPTHKSYRNYGGRGITVCARWRESFINFLTDMGPKPGLDFEIDRIDNEKGYSPENCRWTTRRTNTRNTRRNMPLTLNGETKSAIYWAELYGIHIHTIKNRIKRGMTVEAAIKRS